ncbi:hypothetical protein AX16_009965 [Volvariella volvacea WC 439]|nr:hypothetical protein AX16_009965 [Volvariella volvacea WC 439]
MPGNSNKCRLYLTLQDRRGSPGYPYHVGLLLAPKSLTSTAHNAGLRYHATNSIAENNPPEEDNYVPWRYAHVPYNPGDLSVFFVAKILLAKLPVDRTKTLEYWDQKIDAAVRQVEVKQRAIDFSCVSWARCAVEQLRGLEGPFADVPLLGSLGRGGKLEAVILEAGKEGKNKLKAAKSIQEFVPHEVDLRGQLDSSGHVGATEG